MRSFFGAIMIAILLGASAAQAENRIFIIVNNADEYGIDRCLASGARCGAVAAASYCKSQEFTHAVSFRKVDKDELTDATPINSGVCRGGTCEQLVAIECTR